MKYFLPLLFLLIFIPVLGIAADVPPIVQTLHHTEPLIDLFAVITGRYICFKVEGEEHLWIDRIYLPLSKTSGTTGSVKVSFYESAGDMPAMKIKEFGEITEIANVLNLADYRGWPSVQGSVLMPPGKGACIVADSVSLSGSETIYWHGDFWVPGEHEIAGTYSSGKWWVYPGSLYGFVFDGWRQKIEEKPKASAATVSVILNTLLLFPDQFVLPAALTAEEEEKRRVLERVGEEEM